MQTVPAAIANNARDGVFAYGAIVFPNAGDSWTPLRWGQKSFNIGDAPFYGGRLVGVSRISTKAEIRAGGAGVTKDSVRVELVNTDRYHEQFITNNILGRQLQIYLAPISWNRVKNGSFERYSGINFEEWTENTPGAGSDILPTTSQKTHGAASCFMYYDGVAPAPEIYSNTFAVKAGEYLSVSLDARGAGAGDKFKIAISIGGFYWKWSTRTLQLGADWKEFTTTTSWARFPIESLHWSELGISTANVAVKIYIKVDTTGDAVYVDAVQAEAHPNQRPFIPNAIDLLIEDVMPVYLGQVRDYSWDKSILTIQTNSILDEAHKDIPVTLCTNAVDADWKIPPDNNGKPFPMTYGDLIHDGDWGNTTSPQLAFAILCNSVYPPDYDFYFDRPTIKLYQCGEVTHYDKDSRQFIRERFDDATSPDFPCGAYEWEKSPDLGGRIRPYVNSGFAKTRRFMMSIYQRGTSVYFNQSDGGLPLWTDPEHAYEDGIAVVDIDDAVYNGMAQVAITMGQISIPDVEIYKIYPIVYIAVLKTAGSVVCKQFTRRWTPSYYEVLDILTVPTSPATAYEYFHNVPWGGLGGAMTDKETAFPFTKNDTTKNLAYWSSGANETVAITRVEVTNFTGTISLYEMGVRIDASMDLLAVVMAGSVKGREFQDSWGSRRTAGNQIVYPYDTIESILRDELGTAGTAIDTSSFDTVATNWTSWDYYTAASGQQLTIKNSLEVIDEVCGCSGLLYYVDLNGKHALRRLGYLAPTFHLREGDFELGSIKVGYTERDQVVNSFVIHYDRNGYTGEYTKTIFCNRSDSSFSGADATEYEGKCQTSYAALGNVEYSAELEMPWINAKASALRILKWLIDWNYLQRITVTGKIFMDKIGIEIGDCGTLELPHYLPETVWGSSRFVVESVKIEGGGLQSIGLLEVKNPA